MHTTKTLPPQPAPPAIPNLPDTHCPECLGDACVVYVGGPGEYRDASEQWYPTETVEPCPRCKGTGWAL